MDTPELIFKQVFPEPSAYSSSQVQHAADQFQIAQGYFSSILSAQTVLFAAIVAAIVALYFFFNWRVTRAHIKKETDLHFEELKSAMEKNFEEKTSSLEKLFSTGMAQQELAIGQLRGQIYRTLGEFWDSEKSYSVAFIWWFRAAHNFAKVANEKLARMALNSARKSVSRLTNGLQLSNYVGEYQNLLAEIGDSYKIEKEMLDSSIKEVLAKK